MICGPYMICYDMLCDNFVEAMHVVDSGNIVMHVGYVRRGILAFAVSTIIIVHVEL